MNSATGTKKTVSIKADLEKAHLTFDMHSTLVNGKICAVISNAGKLITPK
jgi:hypothetical protein